MKEWRGFFLQLTAITALAALAWIDPSLRTPVVCALCGVLGAHTVGGRREALASLLAGGYSIPPPSSGPGGGGGYVAIPRYPTAPTSPPSSEAKRASSYTPNGGAATAAAPTQKGTA